MINHAAQKSQSDKYTSGPVARQVFVNKGSSTDRNSWSLARLSESNTTLKALDSRNAISYDCYSTRSKFGIGSTTLICKSYVQSRAAIASNYT